MTKRKPKSAAKAPQKPAAANGDAALQALRGKIDALDAEIQELISQRARRAKEIGVLKGLTSTADFYRPEREAQVLRRVVERNKGPLRNEEMVRLFRELMSACLAQEEPLKVAYLGPEGTFTQSAVLKHFGHSVHALSVPTIDEVFHEVEAGTADFGVAPIENSSEGTVNIHTLDMFLTSPLKVCGEIELRIHQHLMGRMADIKDIKRVCSHPQSLAQCKAWLAQNLPDVEKIPVASNAEAARRARDEEGTAALAGEAAASVYGLKILFHTVEDRDDNSTRFVVVGRKLFPPSGNDKTSILVSASGTQGPGVLLHLLGPLAEHGVNMTRIESRPSRKRKWDYVFFVDLDGHAEDPPVRKALDAIKSQASLFKVLGAYPKAVL
ncbi:MAG TPA: prephenate dehydratase [Gammaproteobacteria bacterium]|jgi:chorismate mutase/prephenate dehydratase|nr:prephenate dehydratase [Gammaproteobacteria bacterium]